MQHSFLCCHSPTYLRILYLCTYLPTHDPNYHSGPQRRHHRMRCVLYPSTMTPHSSVPDSQRLIIVSSFQFGCVLITLVDRSTLLDMRLPRKGSHIHINKARRWSVLRMANIVLVVGGIYCMDMIVGSLNLEPPVVDQLLAMESFTFQHHPNDANTNIASEHQINEAVAIDMSNVLWSRNWHKLATCNSVPSTYYSLEGVKTWCTNRWTTECSHSPEQMKTFFGNCSTDKTQPHIFWIRLQSKPNGDIATFATHVLPLLQHPFELITTDGDNSVPRKILESAQKILDNPLLLAWFTQNYEGSASDPKLYPIPIGLDLHTNYKGLWATNPEKNLEEMKKLRISGKTNNRSSDFWIPPWSSDNIERSRSIQDVRKCLNPKPFQSGTLPINELWEKYTQYRFGLSPPGNGLDCHRTWEMLFFGMIPIVKKSALDPLYEGLPVLLVEDWSDLCKPGFLDESYNNISQLLPADDSILTTQYYKSRVRGPRKIMD